MGNRFKGLMTATIAAGAVGGGVLAGCHRHGGSGAGRTRRGTCARRPVAARPSRRPEAAATRWPRPAQRVGRQTQHERRLAGHEHGELGPERSRRDGRSVVSDGRRSAPCRRGRRVVEGGDIPYLPAALEQKKKNYLNRLTEDPEVKCYLPGIPRATYMPYPFQIVQSPKNILMAYEYASANRVVNMEKPTEAPVDSWMGWSNGKWEGDTLVVEVQAA